MEAYNASILKKSYFSSEFSPYRSKFPFPTHFKRTPSSNHRRNSPFSLKIPFLNSSPFSNVPNLSVSAHLGRPSKRRNSLRKKLTEEQKVRLDTDSTTPNSIIQYPVHIPNEIELLESNENLGNLEERGSGSVTPEKSKLLHDSALWSKLENWVDQYKKDTEFWGVGSGPVFTVFQGVDGNVEKVSISEDEILKRSRIEPSYFKQEGHGGKFVEVNSKISYAKLLAREIEKGEYVLPRNSSIAKFVVSGQESGSGLRAVILQPHRFSKIQRFGFAMVCGFVVFWLVKKVFFGENDGVELTRKEKEMLRRKMKARMKREEVKSGTVEVLPKVVVPSAELSVRPQLDKQELMNSIKAKMSGKELMLPQSSDTLSYETIKFNGKILEIKEMARQAREIERKNRGEYDNPNEEISTEMEDLENHEVEIMGTNTTLELPSVDDPCTTDSGTFLEGATFDASENSDSELSALASTVEGPENEMKSSLDSNMRESMDTNEGVAYRDYQMSESLSVDDPLTLDVEPLVEGVAVHPVDNCSSQIPTSDSTIDGSVNRMKSQSDQNGRNPNPAPLTGLEEAVQSSDAPYDSNRSSTNIKPKIILTVKDAREYLSRKHDREKLDKEPKERSLRLAVDVLEPSTDEEVHTKTKQMMHNEKELYKPSVYDKTSKAKSVINDCKTSPSMKIDSVGDALQSIASKTDDSSDTEVKFDMGDIQKSGISKDYGDIDCNREVTPVISKESWIEKNFHELEPIVKKIGDGFRENYTVAKDRVQEELNLRPEIPTPGYDEDESEFEWMKDESLREIVFQVRENELMGREPFHMVNAEDRQAFFRGLERNVENMSGKLLKLHEWIHSKIENLDYGADGISLYDTPDKVIPRWKNPTADNVPEFLNKGVNGRKQFLDEKNGVSHPVPKNLNDNLQKSAEEANGNGVPSSSAAHTPRKANSDASRNPKIVIESSDGSSKAGKKTGKEYWQHTKKWSREFLELYNAETDPEVKSIMKDMGKDLDRWITDKEIQETAELMGKIPKRRRRYIEKKLDKLKKEVETFGPQAVVSKYREYAEEEEDYLWWLDLPFVLCIELYTNEDGGEQVGFYSLEMAEDLELDPKPYHVIAFEDPGDSKSLCYIIQAHMEMLGQGSAFVVARPPKDTFREAKANGFSVTVIRKGELQLNVDQTLEEVEELISEIGSKIYHDKITREHSVGMGSLMKGVFGSSKPAKRRRAKRKPRKLPGQAPKDNS